MANSTRQSFDSSSVFVGLVATVGIAVALYNPFFLNTDNVENLSRNIGFILIFALAQMMPILVRGLDLSQGGMAAFVSVLAATLSNDAGIVPAFTVCLAFAVVFGTMQGFLVGYLGLSAFVVTLGGGSLLSGAALILSNGQTIFQVPQNYNILGWTNPLGVPLVALFALAMLAGLMFVLKRTVMGREIYAVGSNPKAAFVIGIRVQFVTCFCYVASALLTCAGAIFLSSRITSGSPVLGGDIALQSVAAVVVGGVSLMGGRGTPMGVAFGAVTLAILANLLNLYNISSYWQSIMFGLIIIVAVGVDRLRAR